MAENNGLDQLVIDLGELRRMRVIDNHAVDQITADQFVSDEFLVENKVKLDDQVPFLGMISYKVFSLVLESYNELVDEFNDLLAVRKELLKSANNSQPTLDINPPEIIDENEQTCHVNFKACKVVLIERNISNQTILTVDVGNSESGSKFEDLRVTCSSIEHMRLVEEFKEHCKE